MQAGGARGYRLGARGCRLGARGCGLVCTGLQAGQPGLQAAGCQTAAVAHRVGVGDEARVHECDVPHAPAQQRACDLARVRASVRVSVRVRVKVTVRASVRVRVSARVRVRVRAACVRPSSLGCQHPAAGTWVRVRVRHLG